MTESTENPNEFAFCYNCGKRTNIPSDHGFVWKRPDGSDRVSQCQKCGDELTNQLEEAKALLKDLQKDLD